MKIGKYHNYRSVFNARRAVSVLATLFVMLSLLTPMTVHAENCSVAFGSGQYEAEKGETFSICVYVKSDYGAASYSVIIRYDTEHLTYVDGADGADIASGALQLIGSGAETSIRRMIRFRANNTGNAVVYAESAEVYFVPLTQVFDELGNPGVDEFGNLLVVPAGDPVMYNVAALASAPVTVKTPEETTDDQQTDADRNADNTDDNTVTTQPDDNVADDNTDTQADQPDDGTTAVAENPTGDDQAQENTETGDSGAAQATDSETEANDIWQTAPTVPSAPGEQTEKKTPFVFNTYFVIILAIIVIIAWVDIVFILSRRSESARRRREMELREAEEKEELEEEGLRFADIDEDDLFTVYNTGKAGATVQCFIFNDVEYVDYYDTQPIPVPVDVPNIVQKEFEYPMKPYE